MTLDQFVEVLRNWVKANKQASDALKISADTELLGSGLLDSFDFLDLIVHIESETGKKIDLAAADPEDFSRVRGLYRLSFNTDRETPQHATPRTNILPAGAGAGV